MTVIGFVPARGGSARIPRKNLRAVHGIPLVARTVLTLHTAGIERVVVSTDDNEIADVAALWGAEIDMRPDALAQPQATIDQVVDEWLLRFLPPEDLGKDDLWIAVAQPTSPLLTPTTVLEALKYSQQTGVSCFTVTGERALLWSQSATPIFGARVNSTTLEQPEYYRETGGLVVFPANERAPGDAWPPLPRSFAIVDDAEGIDIDDYDDLTRARGGATPARIQLRYAESFELGSGHRRRCETLAAELQGRHIVDVVDHAKAPLPQRIDLASVGDTVDMWYTEQDLVVLDILDTKVEDVQRLYDNGVEHVVTLEDLGRGAKLASLTVNELYSPGLTERDGVGKVILHVAQGVGRYCGPRWAVLRPEFQGHPFIERKPKADGYTVVVTFGGTDPTDATPKVVNELLKIESVCRIRVCAPPGRRPYTLEIDGFDVAGRELALDLLQSPCMASEFLSADLVVCSSGRTVHEAAACGVPVVSVPVNEREHLHAVCPGVRYVNGLANVTPLVRIMLHDRQRTVKDAREAYDAVDGLGVQRIAYLIDGLLGGML